MAISTDSICMDAVAEIQANLDLGIGTKLFLESLCFIFKFPYELDHVGAEAKLTEIADWFNVQPWVTDGLYATDVDAHITWNEPSLNLTVLDYTAPSSE